MKLPYIIGMAFTVMLVGCKPGCEKGSTSISSTPAHQSEIHNLHQPCEGIWTGSEPIGIAAFRELQSMGIRTIVSVDGVKPDVASAQACGIRYIHLPHGYDGIPPRTAAALARLTKEETGPLFIHCHHGRHRGPAAACIVAMGRSQLTPATAAKYLETAGTGRNYTGLWRDVENFPSLPPDTEPEPLVSSAPVNGMVEAMSQLDRAFDRLVASDKPDAPAALLVLEGFTESVRHLPSNAPEELRGRLKDASAQAGLVYDLCKGSDPGPIRPALSKLKQQCTECHRQFRD